MKRNIIFLVLLIVLIIVVLISEAIFTSRFKKRIDSAIAANEFDMAQKYLNKNSTWAKLFYPKNLYLKLKTEINKLEIYTNINDLENTQITKHKIEELFG